MVRDRRVAACRLQCRLHGLVERPNVIVPAAVGARSAWRRVALLPAAVVAACAAPTVPPQVASDVRVIIAFAPDVVDPADPDFLARLASAARVARIAFVRQMSGDAYVVTVACTVAPVIATGDPCKDAIARVGASSSVRTVEVDGRVRHQ